MGWKRIITSDDTGETSRSYSAYLQTKHWKAMKEKVYEEYGGICGVCGELVPKEFSNVHHRTYKRIGNEKMSDLILLCKSCHGKLHKRKNKWKYERQQFGIVIDRCRRELSEEEKTELMNHIENKYGITIEEGLTRKVKEKPKDKKKKKKKRKE